MIEEVFYLKMEDSHGAPSIPPSEHYYLPKRGIEITNISKTNLWEVRKFEEIPSNAILMKFEEKQIDVLMNAHQEHMKACKESGKEILEYQKIHGKLPKAIRYKPKVNSFDYWGKFCILCEEVFTHPIQD